MKQNLDLYIAMRRRDMHSIYIYTPYITVQMKIEIPYTNTCNLKHPFKIGWLRLLDSRFTERFTERDLPTNGPFMKGYICSLFFVT